MLRKKNLFIVSVVVIFIFFITIHCLLRYLPGNGVEVTKTITINDLIYTELQSLSSIYKYPQQGHIQENYLIKYLNDQNLTSINIDNIWKEANSWILHDEITNISSPQLGKIISALTNTKIIRSDIDVRGTQLKLLLTLQGGQQVVFKPKWYDKEHIIQGPVYAGKDRYQSEIIAFYLSLLLKNPVAPMCGERTVSLKYEILPLATKRLLNTSFERYNRSCIYGKCFYCKKEDPICDNEDHFLTGAVIFNVKKTFNNYRSPWQRTYKKNKKASWEQDLNYCKTIENKLTKKRLLDLVETSIFDFLIQNGDRHHYEVLNNQVLWIDNGKGLGNPNVQHIDILAPLYQCCMLRNKMWKNLLNLSGGELSRLMKLMPGIANLLTQSHLAAMEERLLIIFATVEFCRKRFNSKSNKILF